MALGDELERIAAAAAEAATPGERVAGVLAVEPPDGRRVFLCVFESSDGRTWLVLDEEARPVESRSLVREAASLAALCEIAEETAGGGDLRRLREKLRELREIEGPDGIGEAEAAATALAQVLLPEPRVATTDYLDAVGAASRRLEQALGDESGSPFALAMQRALASVEELTAEVEQHYRGPLA